MKAKDDVDNVGAGRAAKGANPSLRAKNTSMVSSILVFFCSSEEKMKGETGFFDLLYRSFFSWFIDRVYKKCDTVGFTKKEKCGRI